MTRRALEDLSSDECFTLLGQETVGRLVYVDDLGPAAVPVDYALAGHGIVFRSEDGSKIRGVREKHDVAFEVDHIDEAMSEGWSVLVRGHARLIQESAERLAVAQLDLEPWAGGARLNLVGITPFEITGRVIVQRQSPQQG